MDLINKVKDYFQKVVVVNELKANVATSDSNPLVVKFPSKFVIDYPTAGSLKVTDRGSSAWMYSRPDINNYNVQVSAIYVKDSATGFVTVVPLNQIYYNLTAAQVTALENSFHDFNLLYPASASSKVIYSKLSSSAVITQVVYSLQ